MPQVNMGCEGFLQISINMILASMQGVTEQKLNN